MDCELAVNGNTVGVAEGIMDEALVGCGLGRWVDCELTVVGSTVKSDNTRLSILAVSENYPP